ncbi:MAG: glycosyltransferase family 2 protein [Bacteroidota bacterium]
MKLLSIVIPVYNSEENIDDLVLKINEAMQNIDFELILVNDCSKDKSWLKITENLNKHAHIIGINLRKNSGQDNAIICGLNYATGDYITIMDDDLQHSPFDILSLLEKCKEGFDVCYANFNTKHQAAWKNFGSWLNGKVAELLIDKPKGLYLSPFFVFEKGILPEIVSYKGPFPYIQGLIFSCTKNITQIPIAHHKRNKGESNFNLIRSIVVFSKLLTGYSVLPLRIATYTGLFFAVFSFFMAIYYVYLYYYGSEIVAGWSTLVVLLLLIGGLILMSLGLIGEYIGRIYLSLNTKPQYVIKEVKKKDIK